MRSTRGRRGGWGAAAGGLGNFWSHRPHGPGAAPGAVGSKAPEAQHPPRRAEGQEVKGAAAPVQATAMAWGTKGATAPAQGTDLAQGAGGAADSRKRRSWRRGRRGGGTRAGGFTRRWGTEGAAMLAQAAVCNCSAGVRLVGALASPESRRLGAEAAAEADPTGADGIAGLHCAPPTLWWISVSRNVSRRMRGPARRRVCPCSSGPPVSMRPRTRRCGSPRRSFRFWWHPTPAGRQCAGAAGQAGGGGSCHVRTWKSARRITGMKRDAPSGTALALGELVAQTRHVEFREVAVFERHGPLAAAPPGRHRLLGAARRRHRRRAHGDCSPWPASGWRSRTAPPTALTFARGALRAAAWLAAGRPPGPIMDDA